jgi:hypothetical protein
VLRPERSYADRLQLLQLLAERHPYPAGWADQRAGIVLQTKWQDRSGRAIAGEDGRLTSWWPTANWTLTVWQLEALQERGDLADVELAERPFTLPPPVAATLHAYYDRLDAAKPDLDARFELQRLLWRFHVCAIQIGLEKSEPELQKLGAAEARFAESWGRCMVGLLAAVNFPTEFENVRGMQRMLPSRLLSEADWHGETDLSEPQKNTMIAMRALFESEAESGGDLEKRLSAASQNPGSARAAQNHLFETLAFGKNSAPEFLRARL